MVCSLSAAELLFSSICRDKPTAEAEDSHFGEHQNIYAKACVRILRAHENLHGERSKCRYCIAGTVVTLLTLI